MSASHRVVSFTHWMEPTGSWEKERSAVGRPEYGEKLWEQCLYLAFLLQLTVFWDKFFNFGINFLDFHKKNEENTEIFHMPQVQFLLLLSLTLVWSICHHYSINEPISMHCN